MRVRRLTHLKKTETTDPDGTRRGTAWCGLSGTVAALDELRGPADQPAPTCPYCAAAVDFATCTERFSRAH